MAHPRVLLSPEASKVVRALQEKYGKLLFIQSGGCCEGSQPLLYAVDDFKPASRDIILGYPESVPYYMSAMEYKYWQYTQLNIDVVPGVGVGGFSLESTLGFTFVIHSKLFGEGELDPIILQGD